jgi:FKBP-type peptidyl-prolyl cis-trans isomerase FkpA
MRGTTASLVPALAAALAVAALGSGCAGDDQSSSSSILAAAAAATPAAKDSSMPSTAPTDLQITDLKPGKGPAIAKGKTAVVHYTGWLYSDTAPEHKGTKFDSSLDHNAPFSFSVGAGEVIGGWDQGVVGMQAGGRRRLVIPPSLGYGAAGAGGVIPPNATLVFDIELLAIK